MATLVKRGRKWSIKYYDASGKQTWVTGYSDKQETQRLAISLEDQKTKMQRGDLDPQHEQRKVERAKSIADHVAEHRTALEAAGNSKNHVSYTIADIEKFIAHAGVAHAAAITRPMIDAWSLSLQRAEVDSRSTINRRVGSVQAFLKRLTQMGTLTDYVAHKLGKLKTAGHRVRIRRALSADEAAKLLDAAPEERKPLYRFCLLTGARYSQAEALKASDVDFKTRTVTLKTKDNRHRDRVHIVPIHADLLPVLSKLCEGKKRETAVFTMPSRTDAAKLVRGDCEAAKVDPTHIDFHAMRHTFVTRLAEKNVHPKIVQTLAGHADIETTLTYYTHFKTTDETAAIGML